MSPSLSSAELLVIARRRLGLTQLQVANLHSMSVARYKRLENEDGTRVGPSARDLLPDAFLGPEGDRLYPHEECFIHRRRAGLSQADVAQALGRCREWVQQMERGEADATELYQFWETPVGPELARSWRDRVVG